MELHHMPLTRRLVLVGAAALAARPAWAIDPGVASGGYRGDEGNIDVSQSVALAIDNAEGFGDFNRGLRVVLSNVEVLPSALAGLAFPPVRGLARDGKLRGILLEFDPADRTSLFATVLTKPEPGYSLATTTLSNSAGLWTRLDASATRVAGELKPDASDHFRFSFSAPVFTNAVTDDLKGPAAAAGPVRSAVTALVNTGAEKLKRKCSEASGLSSPDTRVALASSRAQSPSLCDSVVVPRL